jgi:uncharacterized protein
LRPLRRCLEIKRKLDGTEQRFACELVALQPPVAVLRYLVDREWRVSDIRLSPGCVTYAVYWTDRPYNVYWWVDAQGESLGYYFNVADSVRLTAELVQWRDLSLDVLVHNDGTAEVLDEHELPPDLDDRLRRYIVKAKNEVLGGGTALTAEIRAIVGQARAE